MNYRRSLPVLLVGVLLTMGFTVSAFADYVIVLTSGKTVVAKAPPKEKKGVYVFETLQGHVGFLRPEQIDMAKTQLANEPKPEAPVTAKVVHPEPEMMTETELRERVRYVTLSNEANGDLEGGNFGSLADGAAPASMGNSSGDLSSRLSAAKARLSAAKNERQSRIDNLPHLVEPEAKSASEARIAALAGEISSLEGEVASLESQLRVAEQNEAANAAASQTADQIKAQQAEEAARGGNRGR